MNDSLQSLLADLESFTGDPGITHFRELDSRIYRLVDNRQADFPLSRYASSTDDALDLISHLTKSPRATYFRLEATDMLPPSGPDEHRAVVTLMVGHPHSVYTGAATTLPLALCAALVRFVLGQETT